MFTLKELLTAYAEHGDALVWCTDDGGAYSANPADYWYLNELNELHDGWLGLRVPGHVLPL